MSKRIARHRAEKGGSRNRLLAARAEGEHEDTALADAKGRLLAIRLTGGEAYDCRSRNAHATGAGRCLLLMLAFGVATGIAVYTLVRLTTDPPREAAETHARRQGWEKRSPRDDFPRRFAREWTCLHRQEVSPDFRRATPGLFPFENSMPAFSSAVLSLRAVFSLPPKNPSAASRRLTVGTETPAIAAKSSWDQRSRARAALIWRIDTFRIDFISILMVSICLGP